MTPWQAWVDGTAQPNPGRIGIGLVLISPAGARLEHSRPVGCSGCNNEAEVHAIAAALTLAAEAGAQHVRLFSDSRFAVDCLNNRDRTEIQRLADLLDATRKRIADFDTVTITWLPRHRNTDADRLARAALGLPPKAVSEPSRRRRQRR